MITAMCKGVGVQWAPNEEVFRPSNPITWKTIYNLKGWDQPDASAPPPSGETSQPPSSVPGASSSSLLPRPSTTSAEDRLTAVEAEVRAMRSDIRQLSFLMKSHLYFDKEYRRAEAKAFHMFASAQGIAMEDFPEFPAIPSDEEESTEATQEAAASEEPPAPPPRVDDPDYTMEEDEAADVADSASDAF